jgi:hypothetical protein
MVKIWEMTGDSLSEIICILHEQSGEFSAMALIRAMVKTYLSGELCFCNQELAQIPLSPPSPTYPPISSLFHPDQFQLFNLPARKAASVDSDPMVIANVRGRAYRVGRKLSEEVSPHPP